MSEDHRKSRTGKRRSSFAPGRISILGHDASTVGELCRQIPTDFGPADRLCHLVRLSLKHAVDQLQKEFGDLPGMEVFNAEAVKDVSVALNAMEKEGVFEKAVESERLNRLWDAGGSGWFEEGDTIHVAVKGLPNPTNMQMDTTIAELEESIKRLHQESAEWDTLVNELQDKADRASDMEPLEVAAKDLPADVHEMAQEYLQGMPDIGAVAADVCDTVKTTTLLIDEYRLDVSRLKQAFTAAYNLRMSLASKLCDENSSGSSNPQQLITKLVSLTK